MMRNDGTVQNGIRSKLEQVGLMSEVKSASICPDTPHPIEADSMIQAQILAPQTLKQNIIWAFIHTSFALLSINEQIKP
jgi:hypothetical protein